MDRGVTSLEYYRRLIMCGMPNDVKPRLENLIEFLPEAVANSEYDLCYLNIKRVSSVYEGKFQQVWKIMYTNEKGNHLFWSTDMSLTNGVAKMIVVLAGHKINVFQREDLNESI